MQSNENYKHLPFVGSKIITPKGDFVDENCERDSERETARESEVGGELIRKER